MAGEATADQIDGLEIVDADIPHVAESLRVGEVLLEDGEAVGILLDLPNRAHPASLEPEIETADSCEQRANRQHSHTRRFSWSGMDRKLLDKPDEATA